MTRTLFSSIPLEKFGMNFLKVGQIKMNMWIWTLMKKILPLFRSKIITQNIVKMCTKKKRLDEANVRNVNFRRFYVINDFYIDLPTQTIFFYVENIKMGTQTASLANLSTNLFWYLKSIRDLCEYDTLLLVILIFG